MASLNPSSDITSFINTVFEAAILVARDNNVMTGLVRSFNDRTGVATRQNSQYGGMTINQIGETDDLVGQAFTPSSIATLTPAEYGGQYFMTDTRIESDPFSVRSDAAQDMGEALATDVESKLISNFSTRSTRASVGSDRASSNIFFAAEGIPESSIPDFVCHGNASYPAPFADEHSTATNAVMKSIGARTNSSKGSAGVL